MQWLVEYLVGQHGLLGAVCAGLLGATLHLYRKKNSLYALLVKREQQHSQELLRLMRSYSSEHRMLYRGDKEEPK